MSTERFVGDDKGRVTALHGVAASRRSSEDGRLAFKPVAGTEFELTADLVLLAMGFTGPERKGLRRAARLALTSAAT